MSHDSAIADTLAPVGHTLYFPAVAPYAQALIDRRPFLLPSLDARTVAPAARFTPTPERIRRLGVHSMTMVPLSARGLVLGIANFLRAQEPTAFDTADLTLASDLAAHAAIRIDNARLYHREHDTALTLQRSMLPRTPITWPVWRSPTATDPPPASPRSAATGTTSPRSPPARPPGHRRCDGPRHHRRRCDGPDAHHRARPGPPRHAPRQGPAPP